jgi:two-component system sensor kinase FixL
MEIEEQRRQLSHLARVAVLGQLSGAFAHELNQPLTAILSNAEAAREVLRRRPDAQQHVAGMLDDIVAADRRASAVIHRLRALLKRGDRRIQVIDTKLMIEEVLELAHTELITRRVEVSSVVSPILPALWGDKVQLQQVLLNLILNGCEAMAATTESDRRLVLMAEIDGPHSVHFAVRDSGTGISPELMDSLFEPFVTTKPDGLGLGLSISRTIVAAHGGRLWAENNGGGGAIMHCVLPVTEAMHVTTHSVVMPKFAAVRDE